MAELLIYLATQMPFLFVPDGYRFVDSRVEQSFGGDALLILESAMLRLRFTNDRAQLLLSLQPLESRSTEWFSPGLLQGLLTGVRPASEVLDEQWARFLEGALPELEHLLGNPDTRDATLVELRKQARLRAKELFD